MFGIIVILSSFSFRLIMFSGDARKIYSHGITGSNHHISWDFRFHFDSFYYLFFLLFAILFSLYSASVPSRTQPAHSRISRVNRPLHFLCRTCGDMHIHEIFVYCIIDMIVEWIWSAWLHHVSMTICNASCAFANRRDLLHKFHAQIQQKSDINHPYAVRMHCVP